MFRELSSDDGNVGLPVSRPSLLYQPLQQLQEGTPLFHENDDSSVEVLTPPKSLNVVEGDNAEFSCTVQAKELNYFINGKRLYQNTSNYTLGLKNYSNPTVEQKLTVIMAEHAVKITCRAQTGAFVNISEPAILLVQGPLSAVGNLSYSFINSSTVNISWSPPFTLPGTNIKGYNVSIENSSHDVIVDELVENNYSIRTVSSCDNVSVTGFNGLNGTPESILITSPIKDIPGTVAKLIVKEDLNLKVIPILELNFSRLCRDEYPTEVNLTVLYTNGTIVIANNIPLFPTNYTDILTTPNDSTLIPQLPMDNTYNATLTMEYLASNVNSSVTFSTCILWVIVNHTFGPSQRFVCHFSPFSDGIGCLIKLVDTDDPTIHFNGTGNRTGDNVAMVTINNVHINGIYQLSVYEIERDRRTILIRTRTIVVTPSPITPPPTTTSTTTTTPTTTSSTTPTPSNSGSPSVPPVLDELQIIIICVGGILLVILLICVIGGIVTLVYCCRKKRKLLVLSPLTISDSHGQQSTDRGSLAHSTVVGRGLTNPSTDILTTATQRPPSPSFTPGSKQGTNQEIYIPPNQQLDPPMKSEHVLQASKTVLRNRDLTVSAHQDQPSSSRRTASNTTSETKPLLLRATHVQVQTYLVEPLAVDSSRTQIVAQHGLTSNGPQTEESSFTDDVYVVIEPLRPDPNRSEEKTEEVKPEKVGPKEDSPEEDRPEDLRPEEDRPEEDRPEEVKPEEVIPEVVRPEPNRPEDRPKVINPSMGGGL